MLASQEPALLFLLFIGYTHVWFLAGVAAVRGALDAGARAGEHGRAGDRLVAGRGAAVRAGADPGRARLQHRAWASGSTGCSSRASSGPTLIGELERTRAELAELHHAQGVAAERERLAREVHDTLAQGYTSIVVLAQTAAAELPAGDRRRRASGWR